LNQQNDTQKLDTQTNSTQQNDTQQNDNQQNDTQKNDIQQNKTRNFDTQHYSTQQSDTIKMISAKWQSTITLNRMILSLTTHIVMTLCIMIPRKIFTTFCLSKFIIFSPKYSVPKHGLA
jgi:hypothetical protein